MKDDVTQRMMIILNALNNISVSGKSNLANLSGSIAMLEDVLDDIKSAGVEVKTKNE